MASNILVIFSLFLALQPLKIVTSSSFLSPLLSPIFDDVCREVKCGKGKCKPSDNSTVPFECECLPGWKQLADDDDDDNDFNLKFLPCVIPNCTFDFSCSKASPPAQEKANRGNESIFDVCRWTDCGGGICNTTSPFTHKCECNEGYYNLLNITSFPCFKECSLGMDCKNLGIGAMNKSTSPPSPNLPVNGSNRGILNEVKSLIIMLVLLALMAW